ncbi:MAG TPA: hypothetical protein VN455_11870 [Methanotrichaceae archaeon]|nr:hypothetical protein [Methanotrichaceae archaeon]
MRICTLIIVAAVVVALLLGTATSMGLVKDKSESQGSTLSQGNTSSSDLENYTATMSMVWKGYSEDMKYMNVILEGYLKKNISSLEAMNGATSLYILSGDTLSTLAVLKAPQNYTEDRMNAINAVQYLRISLWNLGKYFETKDRMYSNTSLKSYNESVRYFNNRASIPNPQNPQGAG